MLLVEEGGGAVGNVMPHNTRFCVILTLLVNVCVPANSRTAMQSSLGNLDTSKSEFRTAWSELQVVFRTAVPHGTGLVGSTVICTLQLHDSSLQTREKTEPVPTDQQRATNKTNRA